MCIQMQDVYETTYETCGQYWPHLHHHVVVAIIIMQITMIGLFGLKSKPSASFATIPILLVTIAYNEYSKFRFLPTFNKCSVKVHLDFLDCVCGKDVNALMKVAFLFCWLGCEG